MALGFLRTLALVVSGSTLFASHLEGPAMAQEGIVAPGIYARIQAPSMDDPRATMQALQNCVTDPTIFHPDGMMVVKQLVEGQITDPYGYVGHGQCKSAGDTLSCRFGSGAPGNPTLYGDLVQSVAVLPGGHLQITRPDGTLETLLARCEAAGLTATLADGTSVLDAIVSRSDSGPVLDVATFAALSDLPSADRQAVLPGTILPPGVYADAFSSPLDPDSAKAIALACAESPIVAYPDGLLLGKDLDPWAGEAGLSPYSIEVRAQCSLAGGMLSCSGSRVSPIDAPEPLAFERLLEPLSGGHFKADKGYLARCDIADLDQTVADGRNVLEEIVRRTDGGPLPAFDGIVLSDSLNIPPSDPSTGGQQDPAKPFSTAETAAEGQQDQTDASQTASIWPDASARPLYAEDSDWPGLLPGVYANLLDINQTDPSWLAERCETSPVTAFADGVMISRSLPPEGYQIDQLFSCNGYFDDIWCDLHDSKGALVDDFTFSVKPAGDEAHELCAAGACFTLHACTPGQMASGALSVAISRPDGGLPLSLE